MKYLYSKDINFPVLMCIPNGVIVKQYTSPAEMIDQAFLLKVRGKGRKFRFISDDFGVYKINDFKIVGNAGPFFGFRFGGPFFITRYARFDTELTFVEKLSLDGLIDFFCKDLEYNARTVKEFRERFSRQLNGDARSAASAYALFNSLALELYFEHKKRAERTK